MIEFLSEENRVFVEEVKANLEKNDNDYKIISYFASYSEKDRTELIAATVYHYDRGLRGKELRSRLMKDYGIGWLFTLQFILLIMKIVYWIRKLRN
jgi:predicted RNase H-related nuclease YkuK (DUF458 family)